MEKRGATNIEFIMAFLLFVGSLTAIFYFFNPISSVTSMESSRDYVLSEIITNTSVEVNSYSVVLEGVDTGISIPGTSGKNAKVVDYYGNPVDSEKQGTLVCFKNNPKGFAVIYFSEDIDGSSGSCKETSRYQIASSINSSIVSEKRALKLKEEYDSDYASLKEQMNIPASMDFSFIIEFPDGGSISAVQGSRGGGEVFSETKMVEMLKKDGTSQFVYLTVSVW